MFHNQNSETNSNHLMNTPSESITAFVTRTEEFVLALLNSQRISVTG